MNATLKIAPVRKSIVVKATPQRAFEVFTTGVDRWWPKSHGIGSTPLVRSIIEPFVGGRWYTQHEDGTDVVVGHVQTWEPGALFIVSWEVSATWKPDPRVAFASIIEVRFTAEANGSTRVDLEHRDFERMGEKEGNIMRSGVEGGWAGILALYAAAVTPNTP
jgi:uncharacterized protein YndB with AHSA1/START domain